MLRDQDIIVPKGDSRICRWQIDDITGPDSGEPTNLLAKSLRFEVTKSARSETPIIAIDDSDPRLRVDDASGGVVSLYLSEGETTIDIRSGRNYLRVYDAETVDESEDRWTVSTGSYTLTR